MIKPTHGIIGFQIYDELSFFTKQNTVDSDLYFVNFLFPNHSLSFEFMSKHSCGRSFPWVETKHPNIRFPKVKRCAALRILIHS